MSKGFNLGEYLKDGRATARVAPTEGNGGVSELNTGREELRYLPLDQIDPDPANFYSLEGLDELAASIELIGLQQPLRVRPNGERWTVVSGHRRRAACMMIRDGGNQMFDGGVPCLVDYGEASDAMRELRLIFANSATRVMSSAEQSKQAERVTELLYQLKEQGVEFPGRMRDHVAEACHISTSKLARLNAIRNNLDSGLLPYYERGEMNEDAAYTLSRFPPNLQEAVARELAGGKRKKLPSASVLKEVLDKLDSLLKPLPCSAHAGAPECHHAEGRVLRSVFTQYSWDICPEGQCCMTCYKGKQGCSGACREAKDRFKLEKDAADEKETERKAAEAAKLDRRRASVEKRCQELLPLIEAAGLRDETKLYDGYLAATAGQVREWAETGAGDKTFYSLECVEPSRVEDLRQMAKRLKTTSAALLGEKTDDGKKESQKPANFTAKPWPKKYNLVEMWEREMWQRVKARREALGLSIEEVYDTYGEQNVRQFEKYENGEPCEWDPITELSLTDTERFAFADKLQCSFDYLYSRSDVPETAEQILNNLPQAELCEAGPHWGEGDPPQEGRYFARIDMGDERVHEAVGEFRGGSWSVFGGPLHESMKVVGWWPLPERE